MLWKETFLVPIFFFGFDVLKYLLWDAQHGTSSCFPCIGDAFDTVRELLAQRRSQQVKQNLNGHQALPPIKPDGHDARIEISQKDNPTDVRRTCGRENLSRERVSQSEIFPENQVVLDTSSATPNERYARTSQTPTDNHEDEDDEHVSATNHSKNLLRTAPRSGSSRRGSSSWQQKEEQRKAKEEERKQQIAMRKQRRDEMHRQRMAQRAAEKEAAEHGEDAVGADDINGSREHSGTVDDHSFASSRHDNRHSDSTHNVKSTGRRVVINDDERLQEHDDFGARESDTDNALEETTVSDQHIQSGHRSNVQSSQRSPSHSERSFTEPHEYHGLESDADPPSETDGFNDAYGVNNSAHKQQLQHVNSNHVEEHEIQPTPPRQQGPKPPTTPRGSAATKSARRNLVRKPAQTGVTHGNNADRREADMDQHMPASPAAHADEAPLSPAQHNAQGDSMSAMFAEAATMEGAHVQVQLKPCSICGRKFASERLQKHMDVCKKASTSKRKTFDQSKARLQGTEAAQFAKNADITEKQYSKKLKKANWKAQSEAFRAAMRAAKNPNVRNQVLFLAILLVPPWLETPCTIHAWVFSVYYLSACV